MDEQTKFYQFCISSHQYTEYQYHLYYFRKIIQIISTHLKAFFDSTKDQLLEAIWRLCQVKRFAFAIMSDFGNLVLTDIEVAKQLFEYVQKKIEDDNNIVIEFIEALYDSDPDEYKEACEDVLRFVINDMLTFANHDLQLAIGNTIIMNEGYELLIDLFSKDYNTFVFVCFPISSFPAKYKSIIKDELEKAIRFYAARMNNDKYRLTSFEQVDNINRLLMEEYKEE